MSSSSLYSLRDKLSPFRIHPGRLLEDHGWLFDEVVYRFRLDLLVSMFPLPMTVAAFLPTCRKKDGTAGKQLAMMPAQISADLQTRVSWMALDG